jgi:hypothetical protein
MANGERLLDNLLLAAAFALLALSAGCATPAPVIRLAPRANDDVVWIAGRAAVTHEKQGVRVATAFERQDEHLLALRVEIQNFGAAPVEVDPDNMTYSTCTGTARETCRPADYVVDPEGKLFALDARRARERANARNDRNAAAPFMFLGMVADVATLGSDGSGSASQAIASESDADNARHAQVISRVEAEKEIWENAALRRTTLFPGQILVGTVYIPSDSRARRVWFQVEIGASRFPFCFEQRVTRLRS